MMNALTSLATRSGCSQSTRWPVPSYTTSWLSSIAASSSPAWLAGRTSSSPPQRISVRTPILPRSIGGTARTRPSTLANHTCLGMLSAAIIWSSTKESGTGLCSGSAPWRTSTSALVTGSWNEASDSLNADGKGRWRLLGEPTSTMPRTRSGCSRARCCARYPPLEVPVNQQVSISSASSRAIMSAAASRRAYPSAGVELCPTPRWSGTTRCIVSGSSGRRRSKVRWVSPHAWSRSTGTPSPCSWTAMSTPVARAMRRIPHVGTRTTGRPSTPRVGYLSRWLAGHSHTQRIALAFWPGVLRLNLVTP